MLRRLSRSVLLLALGLGALAPCAADERRTTVVGHIRPSVEQDLRDEYFIDMLRLALDHTVAEFGPYRLREAPVRMTQSRALQSMEEGTYLDVVWTMANRDRESRFRPVRIPLLKGLLGVRVPVVRDGMQPMFEGVETIRDLRQLQAGQGHDWPDVNVLRANGLQVVTARYATLFRMLAAGRFDYMPRGVTEVWAERHFYDEHGLAPAWQVLFVYRAPIYFFVREEDERLARRLKTGLERAIDDGSFRDLFRSHPGNEVALGRLENEQQTRLELDNPQLAPETPTDDPSLWYQPVFGR